MSKRTAKRRKAKAKTIATVRAKPMKHAELIDAITVDNPAEHAERTVNPYVTAIRTLRDDPIGHMHARGHLGALHPPDVKAAVADARLKRARLFQETWEASGRGMLRSPDFTSAGGGSDPTKRSGINDRQRRAAEQLRRWLSLLGKSGFDLLELVLIEKCELVEAARRRHGPVSKAIITFTGHRLKECLDGLT